MGWSKRSSGHTYDSLSGHTFFVGAHSTQIVAAKIMSKKCSVCSAAEGRKGRDVPVHDCPHNFYGSSKAMEADGTLSFVKEFDKKSTSKLHVEAFVTDNDSSIRAMLGHHNNNSGHRKGKLPDHIPELR